MKTRTLSKLVVLLLVVGALVPATAAKKDWNVSASAKGIVSVGEVSRRTSVKLAANVQPTEDGYSGNAVIQFVLPDGTKISRIGTLHMLLGSENEVLSFTVEINGQFLPIKSVLIKGKPRWVTAGAELLVNGKPVELNLVWNFHLEIEGVTAGH